MALGICELLWIRIILEDLRIKWEEPMRLYCDNKFVIGIAHNLVQHNRTKHVEVDKHFIKEKIESWLICIPYVPTEEQLADILTKGVQNPSFKGILDKLGMKNLFHRAWGGVLKILKKSRQIWIWSEPDLWKINIESQIFFSINQVQIITPIYV